MNKLKMLLSKIKHKRSFNAHEKVSYSQSGEDLIIDFIFKFILNYPSFRYFDVGAHHATYLSNTAIFYQAGMRGVCIEPDPLLHQDILKARPDEICLNLGIGFSENENEVLDFYIMSTRTLNTFSKEEAERLDKDGSYKIVEVKKIPVVHIHKLFENYFVPDLLSIDVEGIDFEIIKSIDFLKYRPKVICLETAEFSPIPPGKKTYDSIEYLKKSEYFVYADTFNNTIFIDKKYLDQLYNRK